MFALPVTLSIFICQFPRTTSSAFPGIETIKRRIKREILRNEFFIIEWLCDKAIICNPFVASKIDGKKIGIPFSVKIIYNNL
jgi:hypothetical protein